MGTRLPGSESVEPCDSVGPIKDYCMQQQLKSGFRALVSCWKPVIVSERRRRRKRLTEFE
jgi:hypothetical protein